MRRPRGILLCVAASSLLAGSLASAQPTPSCPGDCDLDGSVTIDELLRGVNFLLEGHPAQGCDELDDDRDGHVEVNELVVAVVKALIGCRLTGDAAAAAASQAALGVLDAFQVVALGSAAAGTDGGGGDSGSVAGVLRSGFECTDGGKVELTCESFGDAARQTAVFRACRTQTSDFVALIVDGTIVRTIDDAEYCDTGFFPDGAQVVDDFTDLREAITERDVTAIEFGGTFVHAFRLRKDGCAGRIDRESFDGRLAFRCAAGLDSSLCPPEGRADTVTARGLTIVHDAGGIPGVCTPTSTVLGRIELRDGISGQAFDAVCRQFVVRVVGAGTADPRVHLDGGIAFDCLGEVNLTTEVALARAADARCPSSGVLFVRLPDGGESAVRYDDGAVGIDLDGDGVADLKGKSCEDAALAPCGSRG